LLTTALLIVLAKLLLTAPRYAIVRLLLAEQEGEMENILGLIGAITGLAGLLVSVFVVRWQTKVQAQEMAIERARNDRSERLAFLSDRIFDISIPRNLRQPFYEEYISMKGNGTAVKFWLMEGEMKSK
jgi:hypothetical protein